MRCNICDARLSDNEIKFSQDHDKFDPCGRCLDEVRKFYPQPRPLPPEEKELEELYLLEEGIDD